MANIKSAKKRISVNDRQKSENKLMKTTVNTLTKKFRKFVKEGNLAEAEVVLKEVVKLINSSASKGVFHQNNASRKISRLNKALSDAKKGSKSQEVKPAAVAEEVKEAVKAVVEEIVEEVKKPAAIKTTKKVEAVEEAKPKKAPAAKKAAEKTEPAKKETKTTTAKKTTTKKSV